MKNIFIKLSTLVVFAMQVQTSCEGPQIEEEVYTVEFEDIFDTRDKEVTLQERKTWELGTVKVNNDFPTGAVSEACWSSDSVITAKIHPENKPINLSPWYAFSIQSDIPQQVWVRLDYDEFRHRYHPKIKVKDEYVPVAEDDFRTIDTNLVEFKLRIDSIPKYIYAQAPATAEDVYNWTENLAEENKLDYYTYGHSRGRRPMKALDINPDGDTTKPIIVLMGRQHPPEVTGWFLMQSFLEKILDDSRRSRAFLDKYRILVFPMMNPDGVDLGFWRHNLGGVDLNRDWSQHHQPEVKSTVAEVIRITKKDSVGVVLFLDFHSTYENIFYTNSEENDQMVLKGFKDKWISSLRNKFPRIRFNEKPFEPTEPISKNWFYKYFNAMGITYEVGDLTEMEDIVKRGEGSADEMMRILLEEY